MKAYFGIAIAAVLLCNQAFGQKTPPKCPTARPTFGICTFDPNVNCLDDSACQGGQLCCPSGCNKVCTDPEQDNEQNQQSINSKSDGLVIQQCPPASNQVGVCSYDEEKNCLEDSECKNGQMCCSEGCNKVCKEPVTFEPKKPEPKTGAFGSRRY